MKKEIEQKYSRQAGVIKAMGHPTRLFILNALRKKEMCVCDITAQIGDDMSTISKHLLVLKNAGLIASRREANWLFYRLTCPCVLEFSDCIRTTLRRGNV